MKTTVIFGGTGFIGSYLAEQLLRQKDTEKVYLADLKPICEERFKVFLQPYIDNGQLEYVYCDVRKSIKEQLSEITDVDLVANFAAIHREPGHEAFEYYETNILGAEFVCSWCELVKCNDIIFTSSIAPYGNAEKIKDEYSIPVPLTPYGGSKLAAEKIHIGWQKSSVENQLTIVRPGVVFGPGEGGNVSRLIKAVLGGYFFYMGNKQTRKAGVYVKELTTAMMWVHNKNKLQGNKYSLFNMSMALAPSMHEYVDSILKVKNSKKFIPTVPFIVMYLSSFVVEFFARLFSINQPISPVRIKKLVKSNYIDPKYLKDAGYSYKYSLITAMEDWKKDKPHEW